MKMNEEIMSRKRIRNRSTGGKNIYLEKKSAANEENI